MSRASRSTRFVLVAVLAVGAWACSGGSSGCTGLSPIPFNARYSGPKSDNAVSIRLAPGGINYLNSNWQKLVDMFAPGETIIVPVPCAVVNAPVAGDIVLSDQGSSGCASETCGRMDGACDSKDVAAQIPIKITGFSLLPKPTDSVQAELDVDIATDTIYMTTVSKNWGGCVFLSPVQCSVAFDNGNPNGSSSFNRLKATVRFTIDPTWDKLLAFQVTSLSGTEVCGTSSSTPPPPDCLEPEDLTLTGHNTCGGAYCGLANWAPVKSTILHWVSPLIQTKIKEAITAQSCETCGTGKPACPRVGGAVSVCQNDVCMDTTANKCVPRFLGVEGRLALDKVMGSFGVPAGAALDMSVAAGSTATVDQGITLGTRAGVNVVEVADCVPQRNPPTISAVAAPNFDSEADPSKGPYHAAVGISGQFVDLAMYNVHQAGGLCVNMSSTQVGLLNTGLFKTFLPSLGKLTTRDGRDAPMMVVLRPADPPTVDIGRGTYDPVTKKPVEPLLTLNIRDLTVDFYAMIDDRYVRLFSLTADIALPLSLIFEGCSSVQPTIGDLKQLITNIRTANSEILAEDPKVLADLIPAIIGLAEPAVDSALKPFGMPTLGPFKLKVNDVKGVGLITGTKRYRHMALYAQLMSATASCAVASPQVKASLKQSIIPTAEQMRLVGKPLPWPTAIIAVEAAGKAGTPEFAYRVDHGMWSSFLAAPNGELTVSHPALVLQGLHVIEVRGRLAEEPRGISAPIELGFLVDYEPPALTLFVNREDDVIVAAAHDSVTPDSALSYAYQVGGGAVSSFGPARPISLSAVERVGGVTVFVRDETGNVASAQWKAPVIATRDGPSAELTGDPGRAVGCAAAGGWLWLALGAFGGLWRRRRGH